MVLSARFKVDFLVPPTHGPVHFPTQFAVEIREEVKGSVMPATAGVFRHGAVLGERGDGGKVGVAFGAEDADGVVVLLFRIMLRPQFLGGLVGVFGLERIENFKNLFPLLQGFQNVFRVGARTIEVRLIAAVDFNAEALERAQILVLKVRGETFVTTPRVGDVHIGTSDIFVVTVADHLAHIGGDFAATVVIVPREEQTRLFALFLQRLDDEQGGGNVAKVADVDRTGRTGACRADVFFLVGVTVDNPLCNLF